ncbi:hypothetical protein FBU30_011048 [Linnemannia zychae]|nr:hypothetical protein FBU30_011048 [Linnemannia zychae]
MPSVPELYLQEPDYGKETILQESNELVQAVQDLAIQDQTLPSPTSPPPHPKSQQQQQQQQPVSYFAVRQGLQEIKRVIGTHLALGKEILVTRSTSTTSVTSITVVAATDESDAVAIGSTVVREHVHFEEDEKQSGTDEEDPLSDGEKGVFLSPPSSPPLSPTLEGKDEKMIYPGTINASFVKRQSAKQSVRGLEHALRAAIAKTSPDHETSRLLAKAHKIQHLFSVESVNQGRHFDAPESVAQIPNFIKTYKLDLSELLEPDITKYETFNQFFYRKLRPSARPIHEKNNPNIIVSSADCRLCVFESITSATRVWIKGKAFTLPNLLRDETLASQFEGGSIALFRLAPQDYHRFHSPVSGVVMQDSIDIAGGYVTVNPMAVNNDDVDVFTENVRKVTLIELDPVIIHPGDNAGGREEEVENVVEKCLFVSVGALLVGSIVLTGAKSAGTRVEKGDELGYFAYGGSTCILLFQPGSVQFDEDLVATSLKGLETLVRVGERIGERIDIARSALLGHVRFVS